MGRLIDADALIEKLRRTSVFKSVRNASDKNVFEIIDEQPTAFDVNKVVAGLEEQKEYYAVSDTEWSLAKFLAFDDALEIVRKGGKE